MILAELSKMMKILNKNGFKSQNFLAPRFHSAPFKKNDFCGPQNFGLRKIVVRLSSLPAHISDFKSGENLKQKWLPIAKFSCASLSLGAIFEKKIDFCGPQNFGLRKIGTYPGSVPEATGTYLGFQKW